jgi:hypothetical protein
MFSAFDFPWCVNEKYHPAANRDVMPGARGVQCAYNPSALVAVWAPGSIFVRLYFQPEFFAPVMKSEAADTIPFDFE